MAELRSPFDGGVIDVPDDQVKRFTDAGWIAGKKPSKDAGDGAPKGNASRDAWAEYADSIGVEYDGEASRDDIKAAVAANEE